MTAVAVLAGVTVAGLLLARARDGAEERQAPRTPPSTLDTAEKPRGTPSRSGASAAGARLIASPGHGQPFSTTPPLIGREVAWSDLQGLDGRTKDDTWSSYWYNDYIYVNGGLNRGLAPDLTPLTPPTQRGFDVFKILLPQGKDLGDTFEPGDEFTQQYRARKQGGQNPQTQETWQGTGWGQGDQSG